MITGVQAAMPTYDTTVEPEAENTSHWQMIDLVGGHKSVLDVGCATGYLAQALAQRGCTVSGIEMDPTAAAIAEPLLDQLVVGDLSTLDLAESFGERRFEVIVLGDVLEHLVEPEVVLRRLIGLLAPGGAFVISIPNVAHGSVRLMSLLGRWEYRDRGLLDRTHLRFFTRASLRDLLRSAGLVATQVRTTTAEPTGVEIPIDPSDLPDGILSWVRAQPDALTYQFVVRAVRDSDGELAAVAAERDALQDHVDALTRQAEGLRDAAAASTAALDLVQSGRLLRWSAPARRAYGAVRRAAVGDE